MDEEKCEHELNLVDESWVGGTSFIATVECGRCGRKFQGLMVKQ